MLADDPAMDELQVQTVGLAEADRQNNTPPVRTEGIDTTGTEVVGTVDTYDARGHFQSKAAKHAAKRSTRKKLLRSPLLAQADLPIATPRVVETVDTQKVGESVGTKVVETVGTQQGAQAVSTEVVETKGTDRNFEVP